MRLAGWILGSALVLGAATAAADVKREGVWPSEEKRVSLDLEHTPRNAAVQELADEAGWSIVAQGVGTDPIDVHVKGIPANKVLDLLLADSSYVANRDGTLISVVKGAGEAGLAAVAVVEPPPALSAPAIVSAPPAPPPVPPPVATVRGEDRKRTGGSLKIEKGEIVHDVSVVGGSLDVYGTVTGKISVAGGSVHIRDGAHVLGGVTAMGGSVHVDDNAAVDGDVGVFGGSLHRGEKSKIGGAIEIGDEDDDHETDHRGFVQRVGDAITSSALLFVFGAVFFTLMGRRMESLQAEVATRPMRSFALGIVGILGFAVTIVALCVTVIGIPVALLLAPIAGLAGLAAFTAALATVGRALVRHKSESVYVHLAAGCALYLVSGHLPFVGGLITLALVLMGIGTLVATRLGGLWPGKNPAEGPYRTMVT
jgi:hypothetical protein